MGSAGTAAIWMLGAIYWYVEGPFNIHLLHLVLLPFSFFFYPPIGIVTRFTVWFGDGLGEQQQQPQSPDHGEAAADNAAGDNVELDAELMARQEEHIQPDTSTDWMDHEQEGNA